MKKLLFSLFLLTINSAFSQEVTLIFDCPESVAAGSENNHLYINMDNSVSLSAVDFYVLSQPTGLIEFQNAIWINNDFYIMFETYEDSVYHFAAGYPGIGGVHYPYSGPVVDLTFNVSDQVGTVEISLTDIMAIVYPTYTSSEEVDFSSTCTISIISAGCTDPDACNYNPDAVEDDGSCLYTDCNGECGGTAFIDDCGNCVGGSTGLVENYAMDCAGVCNGEAYINECGCVGGMTGLEPDFCWGCTDPDACGYNPDATIDDGSCTYESLFECILDVDGDLYWENFVSSCEPCDSLGVDWIDIATLPEYPYGPEIYGCTDSLASNYNPDATENDGSCEYEQTTCYSNTDCEDGFACIPPFGDCNMETGQGECVEIDEMGCFGYFDPVCGCDGNTHFNYCYAIRDGVGVAFEAPCEIVDETSLFLSADNPYYYDNIWSIDIVLSSNYLPTMIQTEITNLNLPHLELESIDPGEIFDLNYEILDENITLTITYPMPLPLEEDLLLCTLNFSLNEDAPGDSLYLLMSTASVEGQIIDVTQILQKRVTSPLRVELHNMEEATAGDEWFGMQIWITSDVTLEYLYDNSANFLIGYENYADEGFSAVEWIPTTTDYGMVITLTDTSFSVSADLYSWYVGIPDSTAFQFGTVRFDISEDVTGQTFDFNGTGGITLNLDLPGNMIDQLPHSVTVNESILTECTSNTDCEDGFVCIPPFGDCEFETGPGECVDASWDNDCSMEDTNYVCACNGETYRNECTAVERFGIGIAHEDACETNGYGCTDPYADNYNPNAIYNDGSCYFTDPCGCTDPGACNFSPYSICDDAVCYYDFCYGCTDPEALNFDPNAINDDGYCQYSLCYSNSDCEEGQACIPVETGDCELSSGGLCVPYQSSGYYICNEPQYNNMPPVCGCDGQQYDSACEAVNMFGVPVSSDNGCFYQSDIDVLQDIIDLNNSLEGQEPLEIGVQEWTDGRLTELWLNNLQLMSIPETIGNLTNLTELKLSYNQLTSLPESIGDLSFLTHLNLNDNQFTNLPVSLGNLSNLTQLWLNDNQLTNIPECVYNLLDLVYLRLNNNQLTSIPESISDLSNLTKLFFDNNQLVSLPESIGDFSSLSRLHLEYNQLVSLPESICNLPGQCHIYVSGNYLCDEYHYSCIDNWGDQDCNNDQTECTTSDDCEDGFACIPPFGDCEFETGPGECVDQQTGCSGGYAPVCGCDGVTYPNECHASILNGVGIAYEGACELTCCSDPNACNYDPGCGMEDFGCDYPEDFGWCDCLGNTDCSIGAECLFLDDPGVMDCNGWCQSSEDLQSSLGDLECENGYNCPEFGYDCGDCNEDWDGSDPLGYCVFDCGYGDFNNDGMTDVLDIVDLLEQIFSFEPPTEQELACGDLDEDGDITIDDFLCMSPFYEQGTDESENRELIEFTVVDTVTYSSNNEFSIPVDIIIPADSFIEALGFDLLLPALGEIDTVYINGGFPSQAGFMTSVVRQYNRIRVVSFSLNYSILTEYEGRLFDIHFTTTDSLQTTPVIIENIHVNGGCTEGNTSVGNNGMLGVIDSTRIVYLESGIMGEEYSEIVEFPYEPNEGFFGFVSVPDWMDIDIGFENTYQLTLTGIPPVNESNYTEEIVITYPDEWFYWALILPVINDADLEHFTNILNGYENDYIEFNDSTGLGIMPIYILNAGDGVDIGDEIGLFDYNGIIGPGDCPGENGEVLVGAAVYESNPFDLTVYGAIFDCENAGVLPGFVEGNELNVRIWNSARGIELDGVLTDGPEWDDVFTVDGGEIFTVSVDFSSLTLGDANFDGAVDVLDIVILVDAILGEHESDSLEFYVSDLNFDGTVNVLDIVIIVDAVLGG